MNAHLAVAAATVLFAMSQLSAAVAGDPHVGTWKMNIMKSRSPVVVSNTIKMEAQENGLKCIADSMDAGGRVRHVEWAAKYDGKDYPVKGNPKIDSISLTKINDGALAFVQKKKGKQVQSGTTVVSKDGKTWFITGQGQDAMWGNVRFDAVFDKE